MTHGAPERPTTSAPAARAGKIVAAKYPSPLLPDMVDVLWLAIGVIAGVVGTAVAMEAMGKARRDTAPASPVKLTTAWRLRELGQPVLVARDVLDIEVPDGTQVYASGIVDPDVLRRCKVFQVPPVRAEFAYDASSRRALIFTAGVQDGALALLTIDEATVARLETEYRNLAARSDDYVERLQVRELAGKHGVTVETQGLVADVLPWKERFMIRLEDDGHIIGVVTQKDPDDLREERILVRGTLRKDETGYAVIEAEEIRRIR